VTNLDKRSDQTFYSAFLKRGPISDNTSVIDVNSRSSSLVGGQLIPPQKRVPPKLDLSMISRRESEGNIDEIQIKVQIKDDQIKSMIGETNAKD
jgi:hypothetical protein